MDYNLNSVVQRALDAATDEVAERKTSYEISNAILLFTLYKEIQNYLLGSSLKANGFNLFTLRYYIDTKCSYAVKDPDFDVNQIELSPEAMVCFNKADHYRLLAEEEELKAGHLLLALLESDDETIVAYIRDNAIQMENIRKEIIEFILTEDIKAYNKNLKVEDKPMSATPSVDKVVRECCTDLTAQALAGEIDPIIGREEEIETIINTMARRTKNNVLIVGPAGTGKSAIVKGLALKLANNEIPSLANKRIFSLSLGALLGGTQYRGQLAGKITDLFKSFDKMSNVILFIDELHVLMKSSNNKDSTEDIPQLLKQELGHRKFQLIGCTTTNEVRMIQEDPAFMRRLNVIELKEPSKEEAIEIMKGLRYKYEEFHNVVIPDDTLDVAVNFAKRYVTERALPDSAIDVIDSAAAKLKLKVSSNRNDALNDVRHRIYLLEDKLMNTNDTEELFEIYKNYKKEYDEYNKIKEDESYCVEMPCLTVDDIANEIETRTKIPVSRLMASDKQKLLNFEEEMHKYIIGQDFAIKEISNAIRRSSAGLSNPDKPIASFLFSGPSGVGKTEAAKVLADLQFNSRDNMIRIDCSEYKEAHSVSKLVGSMPGYVGYDEGGQLTEKVRHNPYSVVLFDELEKAHPSFSDILLQILDEGTLTDSHGVKVSFKNTIIIITSNLGSGMYDKAKSIGFGVKDEEQQEKNEYETLKELTLNAIKKFLKPELINRLSCTVVFHPLNKEQQRQITRLLGKKIDARLAEQNIVAKCSDAALDYITDEGYDVVYGARPLERALVKYLEEPLALLLLEDKIKPGDFIYIDLVDDELQFDIRENVTR